MTTNDPTLPTWMRLLLWLYAIAWAIFIAFYGEPNSIKPI